MLDRNSTCWSTKR